MVLLSQSSVSEKMTETGAGLTTPISPASSALSNVAVTLTVSPNEPSRPHGGSERRTRGHICDRCNRRILTGDTAVVYAIYYDANMWVVQCVMFDCRSPTIGLSTGGADMMIKPVWWPRRLVGV